MMVLDIDNKIYWTCSDFSCHKHKWKFTAFICGRIQYLIYKFRVWLWKKKYWSPSLLSQFLRRNRNKDINIKLMRDLYNKCK